MDKKVVELDLQWQATRFAVDLIDMFRSEAKEDWTVSEIDKHRTTLLFLQDQLLNEKRRIIEEQ